MIRNVFNVRVGLTLIAIVIVSGTILYSQLIAKKIAIEERQKVEQWVEAGKLLVEDDSGVSDKLVGMIISGNQDLPIIETDEHDRIIQYVNVDTMAIQKDAQYLSKTLSKFKKANPPIVWSDPNNAQRVNRYYYGNTSLLDQVLYYPLVQLLIVALFIVVTIILLTTSFRSSQNRVWAGMAKEAAHQLGTPLSSLQGWVEILKETPGTEKMVLEMSKDVERLRLVSDRFGKIGSTPHLEPVNIIDQVSNMMDYIKKRAAGKVQFEFEYDHPLKMLQVPLSAPLFDWVIENLLKNALDAMDGHGRIRIHLFLEADRVTIDVSDTGKGIARQHVNKVFNPGFTTKKRGWGLGLSLSKRIVEQYHNGQLFVKSSESGKGTTFRIVLNK